MQSTVIGWLKSSYISLWKNLYLNPSSCHLFDDIFYRYDHGYWFKFYNFVEGTGGGLLNFTKFENYMTYFEALQMCEFYSVFSRVKIHFHLKKFLEGNSTSRRGRGAKEVIATP